MKKITNIVLLTCLMIIQSVFAFTGVDPTRPPTYQNGETEIQSGPLTVSAIFSFSGYKLAIINGESLKVGEKINEFTIIAITPYTVELIGPDNKKEIIPLITPVMQAVY